MCRLTEQSSVESEVDAAAFPQNWRNLVSPELEKFSFPRTGEIQFPQNWRNPVSLELGKSSFPRTGEIQFPQNWRNPVSLESSVELKDQNLTNLQIKTHIVGKFQNIY